MNLIFALKIKGKGYFYDATSKRWYRSADWPANLGVPHLQTPWSPDPFTHLPINPLNNTNNNFDNNNNNNNNITLGPPISLDYKHFNSNNNFMAFNPPLPFIPLVNNNNNNNNSNNIPPVTPFIRAVQAPIIPLVNNNNNNNNINNIPPVTPLISAVQAPIIPLFNNNNNNNNINNIPPVTPLVRDVQAPLQPQKVKCPICSSLGVDVSVVNMAEHIIRIHTRDSSLIDTPPFLAASQSLNKWLCRRCLKFRASGTLKCPTQDCNVVPVISNNNKAVPNTYPTVASLEPAIQQQQEEVLLQPVERPFKPFDDDNNILQRTLSAPVHTVNKIPASTASAFFHIESQVKKQLADASDAGDEQTVTNSFATLLLLPKLLAQDAIRNAPINKKLSAKMKRLSNRAIRLRSIQNAIARWNEGPDSQRAMVTDLLAIVPRAHLRAAATADRKSNQRRAKELLESQRYRDAISALISAGMHDLSNPIVQAAVHMQHPPNTPSLPLVPEGESDSPPLQLPLDDFTLLKSKLNSFPVGSSGGRDGYYPQYYKDALNIRVPAYVESYLKQHTRLVNVCLKGALPSVVMPFCAAASMNALRKPDTEVPRPIAVGLTLRRLVAKVAAHAGEKETVTLFSGLQMGVGVKNGAESIAHSLRFLNLHSSNPWDPDIFVLLVDFCNAFNQIDRTKLFVAVRKHCPSLSKWVESCYLNGAWIFMPDGSFPFQSQSGVQQGDPLGPLLFSLVLQTVIKIIKVRWPNLKINVWYLDDGTLVGSKDDLIQILNFLIRDGPSYGLHLNTNKTQVWSPLPSNETNFTGFEGLANIVNDDSPLGGIKSLGAPFGNPAQCNRMLKSRVNKIIRIVEEISELNPQMKYFLLQKCGIFPRICYSLRTAPSALIEESLELLDAVFARTAQSLLPNSQITQWHITRFHLQRHLSGLNLPRPSLASSPAYTGSVFSSIVLQASILKMDVNDLLSKYNSTVLVEFNVKIDNDLRVRQISMPVSINQHKLTIIQSRHIFRNEIIGSQSADVNMKRNAVACTFPGANAYLFAPPVKTDHTNNLLDDRSFEIALQMSLGLNVYKKVAPCPKCSNNLLDLKGHHSISCSADGTCTHRHDNQKNVIHKAATDAQFVSRREVPNILPDEVSRNKKVDIIIDNFNCLGVGPLAIDVVVVNAYAEGTGMPLQPYSETRNVPASEFCTSQLISIKAVMKKNKYQMLCRTHGLNFSPFVISSLGGYCPGATEIIKCIAESQAARYNITKGKAVESLRHTLAIDLVRSQAYAILARGDAANVLLSSPPCVAPLNLIPPSLSPPSNPQNRSSSSSSLQISSSSTSTSNPSSLPQFFV